MKKQQQLGMNPSTASGRLVKDLLWNFIEQTEQHNCCKCGEPMTRDTFSIEHLIPWLDSNNPLELYFDIDNISYSHRTCNYADRRMGQPNSSCGTENKYNSGCRCEACVANKSERYKQRYSKESRKERYLRTGN